VGVREHIKRAARRMGYEVRQYTPLRSYAAARERLFATLGIDVVVDVGANTGQYGELLRGLGYRGRLISLEPVPEAFATLERAAAADGRWTALRLAAADVDGEIELRVTADSRSSSVLARNDRFADRLGWAPREVVAVPARRLATLAPELLERHERAHLKVDVQGYERQVLEGAADALDRFHSLELELNVAPLYDGQARLVDLVPLLEERGFHLVSLEPILLDDRGRLIELDGLFAREAELPAVA
jgi:FkbM family methyltransferase